ncbi:hypothetical protein RB653_004403 [Dictyostelium firmibasis]|uniref:Poly [ADP-ribose] polymerase n=1 Tax=Dictyostelium firmibasis TaxID=79012 RepID=A0AAN7YY17_9MYCE
MATKNTSPFEIEYAKSDRSTCSTCQRGINKDAVRIGYKTKSVHFDGMDVSWHHLKCKCPQVPSFADLVHWEYLRWEDQLSIKTTYFPKEKYDPKSASEVQREKYLKALWEVKDDINNNLKGPVIKNIIQQNKGYVEKVSPVHLLHTLSDWMLNGRTGRCPTCKNFDILFNGMEYQCKGWISGFTKCDWKGDSIERWAVQIPKELTKNKFLSSFKYSKDYPKATTKYTAPDEAEEEEQEEEEVKTEENASGEVTTQDTSSVPLDPNRDEDEVPIGSECINIIVAIAGAEKILGIAPTKIKTLVQSHGGQVVEDPLNATLMISCEEEVNKTKKTKKVQNAIDNIPIFPPSWIEDLCNRTGKGIELRKTSVSKSLVIAPSQLADDDLLFTEKYFKPVEVKRQTTTTTTSKKRELEPAIVPKKAPKPGSNILQVNDDFKYGRYEIYVHNDPIYGYTAMNVMLNSLDIESNANRFYQIQMLKQTDKTNRFTVYLRWGRVGVNQIGGQKDTTYSSYNTALVEFAERFEYFTAQKWEDRHKFKKLPRKYYMISLDDGNDEEEEENLVETVLKRKKSTQEPESQELEPKKDGLPQRVVDLVKLMFDPEMMKKQLQSMNVDTDKMPLGKIKKSQLIEGYKVLSEIQDILNSANPSRNLLLDCATRFYTLIPHNFGNQTAPLIDTVDLIKAKMQLVETLIDVDIAANLKKQTESLEGNMIENQYLTLKTKFTPLDKDSVAYQTLVDYVANSQDKQFRTNICVQDILSLDRENESERFTPWAKDKNRLLLWHGSRLTNFVSIVSQGLRIAPPSAPKTGYRFGKGIYFADCISKSFSYCFTSSDYPTALMLLCEVSLGDMNELKHDTYMEEAPKPFHSTKALGMAAPHKDGNQPLVDSDGLVVPLGKMGKTGLSTSCTHNEFIVYKIEQVRIKYILRVYNGNK